MAQTSAAFKPNQQIEAIEGCQLWEFTSTGFHCLFSFQVAVLRHRLMDTDAHRTLHLTSGLHRAG